MDRFSNGRRFNCLAIAILTSALLFSRQPAVADQVSFFSTGAGKQKCEEYLQASQGIEANQFKYNQRSQRTYVSENAIYDHWIYGFISAMNLASASNGNQKPDIQVRNIEMINWIRGWCASHPEDSVFDGAYSFVKAQWAQKRAN